MPKDHDHHDECDRVQYEEGGICTCDLIEEYGDQYDREDY